jgi:protein arginine N-methyltransferase 5
VADYARAVNNVLGSSTSFTQISIRIPISDPAELLNHPLDARGSIGSLPSRTNSARLSTGRVGVTDLSATWEIWDVIRTVCGYNPKLSLSTFFFLLSPPSQGGWELFR